MEAEVRPRSFLGVDLADIEQLRTMLVKRRTVARSARVGLAHISALSRISVKIASVIAGTGKVIDMRSRVYPNGRAISACLLLPLERRHAGWLNVHCYKPERKRHGRKQ